MPVTTRIGRAAAYLRAHPRLAAALGIATVAVVALGAGLAVGSWHTVCRDCPSIARIYTWEPVQATKILSHDGQLVAELFQERRTPISLSELPPHVPQAFLAVEDQQFYRHGGFNPWGILRSAVRNVVKGRVTAGGSTITQQLARNMFEEEIGYERRLVRKLKELRVAFALEEVYSKDQILEAYINQINFDRGWFGIETAAQRYFGKPARELNPAEAALLAAVIRRPADYNPFQHPDRARARRNLVLDLMAGEGYLTEAEARRWKEEPLPERPHGYGAGELAPYFVEWVRETLDDRYGNELYRRGFRVFTTLDLTMQRQAVEAMRNGWSRIEGQPGFRHPRFEQVKAAGDPIPADRTPYLQGMFVALDPRTGEIRALVGGRDFGDSKFNRAVQARRQAGSVFKPFVYAAAIASGIPASHVIYDSPIMLEQVDGTVWSPKNYDGDFKGPLTLRQALKLSINLVAVKLGMEVGLETVAQTAQRLGIATPINRFPSTSIGAADVIPIEVAEAYTAFATDGIRARPRAILRVEDAEGRVLWEAPPQREQVLDTLTAAVVRDMLRDVVDHGTAYPIRNPAVGALPYEIPAAGKTGTTNDATDVWFVGFTPDLLAAVWFGFDMPKKILPGAAGGVYAAPVWADFMRSVYLSEPPLLPRPEPWALPPELTTRSVDQESGLLATEWCPLDLVYTEIYIPGTEPTEACDIHGPGLRGVPLRGVLPPDSLADSLRVPPPRIRF